jgi:flagellar hook-basal body complex protein FliE
MMAGQAGAPRRARHGSTKGILGGRRRGQWGEKPSKHSLVHPFVAGPGAYSGGDGNRPMSDLRIQPFDFQAALARAGLRPDGMPRAESAAQGGFRSAMVQALQDVSRDQLDAERLQRELSLDNPKVSLEQTMLAMNKAQIGFQATLQVRNRLVQAYTEIMNMQV